MKTRTLLIDINAESSPPISKQTPQHQNQIPSNVSYSFLERKIENDYQFALKQVISEAKELSW